MKKKKKKKLRGGLTKEQRLALAPKKHFMKFPELNKKIRRYARWFYVKPETAIKELRELGVTITDKDASNYKKYANALKREKRKRREKRKAEAKATLNMFENTDCDEHFAYIAGYTTAGFAYGITWEEMAAIEKAEMAAEQRPEACQELTWSEGMMDEIADMAAIAAMDNMDDIDDMDDMDDMDDIPF